MATAVDIIGKIQDINVRLRDLRACLDQSGMTTLNPNNTTAVGLIDQTYTNMAQVEQAVFTGAATPNTP